MQNYNENIYLRKKNKADRKQTKKNKFLRRQKKTLVRYPTM